MRQKRKIDWAGMASLTLMYYAFLIIADIGDTLMQDIVLITMPYLIFISVDRIFEHSGLTQKLEIHARSLEKRLIKRFSRGN